MLSAEAEKTAHTQYHGLDLTVLELPRRGRQRIKRNRARTSSEIV